jgi:hypothetical protein
MSLRSCGNQWRATGGFDDGVSQMSARENNNLGASLTNLTKDLMLLKSCRLYNRGRSPPRERGPDLSVPHPPKMTDLGRGRHYRRSITARSGQQIVIANSF